jgi:hypothetical protein
MNRRERRQAQREKTVIHGNEVELGSDAETAMQVDVAALRWMYPAKVVLVYEQADEDGSDVLVLVFEDEHGQFAIELRPAMALQISGELTDALNHLPQIRASYRQP